MYDDIEADFWKEHFSHVLHKNMVRIDAEKLTFDNAAGIIEGFKSRHPDLKPDVSFNSSYVTFELFITQSIKLRLYIQNQVKGSLMQFDGGDYVKLVDARFPYNPFPEIEEFLSHMGEYLSELENLLDKTVHSRKQMMVAEQFIRANISRKFRNRSEITWKLEQSGHSFILSMDKDNNRTMHLISIDDFMKDIENL